MKTLIVSLLVVLSAGFAQAEDDQQAPPRISVEEAREFQAAGERFRQQGLDLSRDRSDVYGPVLSDESDYNTWSDDRRYRLRLECEQRRRTESTLSGDSLVDRTAGNRVRRNLYENRLDNTDDFDTFRRADNSIGRVRIDPCAGINPPEPREERNERGCRYRLNGNQEKFITGSCRW